MFLLQITAVCDFFTYARYITQGLVKSDGKIQFRTMIYDEVIKSNQRNEIIFIYRKVDQLLSQEKDYFLFLSDITRI